MTGPDQRATPVFADPPAVSAPGAGGCSWDRFLDQALAQLPRLVSNAALPVEVVNLDGLRLPVTLNLQGDSGTSWVASLANAYGPYARAEMALVGLPRAARPLCAAASLVAQGLLGAGGLSGGAFLNNWLLSTNLHPHHMGPAQVLQASSELAQAYPRLPVVLRSLTPSLHAPLMAELVRAGWLLLPSRQVWLHMDLAGGAWRSRSDARRDLRLDEDAGQGTIWVDGSAFTDDDFAQAAALYQDLYRRKYPRFNPDYGEAFLRQGCATGWLRLAGLRRKAETRLCGVLGVVERDGMMATPVLGYELGAPASEGLYRRLFLRALLWAEAGGHLKHCSAGAGAFKHNRGATRHIEYAAVDARHLPLWRRGALRALHAPLQQVAVPFLSSRVL
jgi:hypothetical protein